MESRTDASDGASGAPQSSPSWHGRLYSWSVGHFNTLRPFFERSLRPAVRPLTEPFSAEVHDPDLGPIVVSGEYLRRDTARAVIVIHGLGGSVRSGYMGLALRAADELGVSALLLNCRGSDLVAGDIYHSGLTADLRAAIESPLLSSVREIALLGYSIGGHVALCHGCEVLDPRVTRIAAICSPLHLEISARDFDAPRINVYRGHVMDGLKEIYTAAYQRNPRGIVPHAARKISRIRDWDEAIVAPRFGFASASDYYQSQSVGPKLHRLSREALYIGATFDPMVRCDGIRPYLDDGKVRAVWDDRAGHLGFGPGFTLGRPGPLGLEPQVLSWLFR